VEENSGSIARPDDDPEPDGSKSEAVQLRPPFLLLKTSPPVPAYTVSGFVGSTAKEVAVTPNGPLVVHRLTPP